MAEQSLPIAMSANGYDPIQVHAYLANLRKGYTDLYNKNINLQKELTIAQSLYSKVLQEKKDIQAEIERLNAQLKQGVPAVAHEISKDINKTKTHMKPIGVTPTAKSEEAERRMKAINKTMRQAMEVLSKAMGGTNENTGGTG